MPWLCYILCAFFISFFVVVPISLYFANIASAIDHIDNAVYSAGGLIMVFHILGHLWIFFSCQQGDTIVVEDEP